MIELVASILEAIAGFFISLGASFSGNKRKKSLRRTH
jgi:hypothetical protein